MGDREMTDKPLFNKIMQVGLVVKDLDASVRKQWDEFGIGPWAIYEFDPSRVTNLTVRGKPVEHAMRMALAMIGDVMWELIQPLDDRSIYAEFLKEHGEGIHHILFDVDDFHGVEAHLKSKGHEVCQGGQIGRIRYAYFDTMESLHTIAEIASLGEEEDLPPPDATYP